MNLRKVRNKKNPTSKKRRINAILYPLYKAFSWDLLSFYSIEFLFYTITKHISASEVLILTAIYILSKILFQLPAVFLNDYLGKKRCIIIGNLSLIIYILLLIKAPNFIVMAIANLFCGFGYDLKTIAEGNLLYDSVATKGGEGIYTQLDAKGSKGYYILDTIFSLIAGYLFVINNYLPIYICLGMLVISTLLSINFQDIYEGKKKHIKFNKFDEAYSEDIKTSFKFIKRSKRMKALILFTIVFYGFLRIIFIYRNELLTTQLNISAEQFSIIYAIITLAAGLSVSYTKKVQEVLKKRTLAYISIVHILAVILVGTLAIIITNNILLPIILICYSIMKICEAQWFIKEYAYLKNFTSIDTRNKISFTFELITGIGVAIISMLGSILIKYIEVRYAMLLVGLLFLAVIIVVLDYMKTRIGLRPSQYSKEDIKFYIES